MSDLIARLARLAERVNQDAWLVQRGRFVDATVLLDAQSSQHLISVRQGRIAALTHGPFVMPSWTFALRAPLAEWEAFWQPLPAPGHHDLFAMRRRKVLSIEGNLQPFMANLLWFKDVLAAGRGETVPSGAQQTAGQ
ncbi:MAG: hypothetical protein KGQ67_17460 [Betaproteobacteria bacterium]|nr:hypothetical protein [Betaproteobacteria bacterium]